jgi:hypothetical protein
MKRTLEDLHSELNWFAQGQGMQWERLQKGDLQWGLTDALCRETAADDTSVLLGQCWEFLDNRESKGGLSAFIERMRITGHRK